MRFERFLRVSCAAALTATVAGCVGDVRAAPGGQRSAAEAFRVGQYDEALRLARAAASSDTVSVSNARLLVRVLLETGKYAEAESVATALSRAPSRATTLASTLGEALVARGRLAEAEAAFTRAIEGRADDSLSARLERAVVRFDRGDHEAAMREFDAFIDVYNARRSRLTARELMAVGIACTYLGRDDPQLFKDALKAFDEAIARDSMDLEIRVRLGELFLEKYNGTDAASTLNAVLRVNPNHPRALLAMARVRQFDGGGAPAELLRKSLEQNAASPDARALSSLLLIDLERYAEAAVEAEKGLVADSSAPAPLAALAAAHFLAGDTARFRASLARAHTRQPRAADAEIVLADVAARNRLYRQAAGFAKQGVDRDPKASRALALLGINQLRNGDIANGKANLDKAFALDPYDPWAKNTLDLLDTYPAYDEVKTPRFIIAIEKKDAPLVATYAEPLVEMAYDTLAARYGFRPEPPVRVEMFRSHADFSVRTLGLPGLSALGVSFGNVVAMDSPGARERGEFNWGSTLWHELAHTFTLGASGHRVPRWLSEGLSVYEERRARKSWGADITPQFAAAVRGGQVHPVSRLNDGFMRPKFPEQIIFSYYQASLVVEMIERDHGIEAIRQMLTGYGRGLTTEQVFEQVLKTEMPAFDRKFDQYMRDRFSKELLAVAPAAPREGAEGGRGEAVVLGGPLAEAMRDASRSMQSGDTVATIRALERAKALFPAFATSEGPYWFLAQLHLKKGDTTRAAAELDSMSLLSETAYDANLQLAAIRERGGDTRGAIAALDRAMYIWPFDAATHARFAELATKGNDHRLAVRERRALLALDPVDKVEALYQLAAAYAAAGEVASARREVLRALELAPNYEKAQALLLQLRGRS